MNKKTLRKQFLQLRQAQSWRDEQRQIAEHLSSYFSSHPTRCVGLYWPIKGEIDIRGTMRELQIRGKIDRIALPRLNGKQMQFFDWLPSTELKTNALGLTEPVSGKEEVPDVLLVPCVALSVSGYRLGYGGGYFDRYLEEHPQVIGIGVLAEVFLSKSLPTEGYDRQLHAWVTESGLHFR